MKINLIEYFVETVRRFPERNAIIDGERKVTFIGTGSVVLSNVKAGTTVFGNPAKKIEF